MCCSNQVVQTKIAVGEVPIYELLGLEDGVDEAGHDSGIWGYILSGAKEDKVTYMVVRAYQLVTEAICKLGHTRVTREHVDVDLANHIFQFVYVTVVRMDLVVGVPV